MSSVRDMTNYMHINPKTLMDMFGTSGARTLIDKFGTERVKNLQHSIVSIAS
jgi:hypothetical protein